MFLGSKFRLLPLEDPQKETGSQLICEVEHEKEYTYEVCVTKTSNTDGSPVSEKPLKFTAANHDDFYAILERFRTCSGPVGEAPLEFVIGLKLFVDAVMKNKDREPFASMVPYVKDIMKTLKADIKKNTSKPPQE